MAVITRLYADRSTADAALAALKEHGEDFSTEIITAPAGAMATADQAESEPGPEPDSGPLLTELAQAGVDRTHAAIYAEHLKHGGALLVTAPLFMHGQAVSDILDGFHATPVELPDVYVQPTKAELRAAPLSAALGWRVLLSDPAPLSRRLGWRTLIRLPPDPPGTSSVSRQSRDAAPLSRVTHLPTLSADPAPLSRLVKFRTLWDRAAPLSERAKVRTLLDEPAPLSKRAKFRTLIHDPAPLSRLLNLPVLTKRQQPLLSARPTKAAWE